MRREAATERLLRTCQRRPEGETQSMASSNWLGLSSFGLGAAGMFATVYCTQAILPTLGREFGVGAARTGLTISVVWLAGSGGLDLGTTFGQDRAQAVPRTLQRAIGCSDRGPGPRPKLCCLAGVQTPAGSLHAWPSDSRPKLRAGGLRGLARGKAMGCYLSSLVAGGLIGRVGVAHPRWRDGASPSPLSPCCPA